MNYKHLLQPLRVGRHIIKNRLVYPNASPHFLQGPEDFPADSYRAFQGNLARNGAGIVTVAEWNNPDQRKGPPDMDMTHMQSFDLTNPAVHNYLSQMAEEVHFYGSKLLISLTFGLPKGYSLNGGFSMFPPGAGHTVPAPVEMIRESVAQSVKTARFYKNLGFDGLSCRCDMSMTPAENPRQDEYGGSLENRTRYLRECLTAIKKELGDSFIIEGVIAWEQPDGYGFTQRVNGGYFEKDAVEFIRLTEGVIDILQIRENNGCTSHPTGYTYRPGEHPALDFAARMKKAGVKMLLEPIGGFQDPEEMERALVEGKCDMFGVARGFLADYEYGEKLYAGRGEDIVPCLKCNKCHGVILPENDPWVSVCSVNPVMGKVERIGRMTANRDTTPRRVAVIGGGPAGIRAALYAARLGHEVTLYEKTDTLGGQLFHSEYFSFKWPVWEYRNWLVSQLDKSGVNVRMNTAPTPEQIEAEGYYAVIAALGATARIPDGIEGLREENGALRAGVMTCLDAIPREKELGKRVVIVGGSEVAMETAMFLCENGHEVTVLTRQKELGHNASKLHYITMAWVKHNPDGTAEESPAWERYSNLRGIVNATTTRIGDGTVQYRDENGQEHSIEADSVLLSGGMTPLTEEAMAFAGRSPKFFAVGDCNFAGNLQVCNEQAYATAMNI